MADGRGVVTPPRQLPADVLPLDLPKRERGKQDRRDRILDVAESLIRETGSTDFPMALLAERAGVSGPTPYNLFGSKSALLYAVLNRSLDPIFRWQRRTQAGGDPIMHVMRAGSIAAQIYAADPRFYRALYRVVLGVSDDVHRPAFLDRAFRYWQEALAPLDAAGQMPPAVSREVMSRMLVTHFLGTLDQWVQGELDDDQFPAQISFGVGLKLLGLATERQRGALLARLNTLRRCMPAAFLQSGEIAKIA